MESLLTLRKKANELGIQNYAKYSKEELAKLIEQKQAGITTVTDPEYIASDEDLKQEEKMVAEHAENIADDAEEPRPEDAKKEKEKKEAPKKKEKEKKPRAAKKPLNVQPKEKKPATMKELSSKVYDELMKNDGRSLYQIAKDLGTYYTVVKHVCDRYFIVIPD